LSKNVQGVFMFSASGRYGPKPGQRVRASTRIEENQMTRFNTLASRPKRTLAALAVVLAAVGITVGSGANFSSTAASATQTFTAGSLVVSQDDSGFSLTATNMRPGDQELGIVDVANSGTLSGTLGVKQIVTPASGSASFAGYLQLRVQDCGVFAPTAPTCIAGSPNVYSGVLTGLSSANLASNGGGQWVAGEKHRYKFTLTFPNNMTGGNDGLDNAFQNKSVTSDFTWTATS
jgi:hypothetical protein